MSIPNDSDRASAGPKAQVVIPLAVLAAVLVIIGAVFALVALAGRWAPSSGSCASCHVMSAAVASWKASPHAKVACYGCHDAAYAWYDFPGNLLGPRSMLSRRFSGEPSGSVEPTATLTIRDAVCERCHTLARAPSVGNRVIIDHAAHARRNRACLSCHSDTSHPRRGDDEPAAMMARCNVCHGLAEGAKAPGTCETCHPKSFDLRPGSHRLATWKADHGIESQKDPQRCMACHTVASCLDCHGGVEMPHTVAFKDSGHGEVGKRSRDTCAKCHGGKDSFCDECHHAKSMNVDAHLAAKWRDKHPEVYRQVGARACHQCHEISYCPKCHVNLPEH